MRLGIDPAVRALAVLGALLAALYVYAGRNRVSSDTRVVDRERFRAAELERLKEGLVDPEGVRLRDTFVSASRGRYVVCGEINARGEAGRLTGYQRFIVGPTFKAIERDTPDGTVDDLWSSLCERKR